MRRTLVIIFFVVVFGLPVAWYLFLQMFGQNRFDLPKIEKWDTNCLELAGEDGVVFTNSNFTNYPNQFKRIISHLNQQSILSVYNTDSCNLSYDLYLVDEEGWVRGHFRASREETDRLLTEIEIYIENKLNE